MKTKDVLKTGIDRNFLRKCIDQKIITPSTKDSETIIHKQYIPKEYSQEDVESVWNAYLYRKMGLSYDQIKTLRQGGEISLRASLNSLIEKYEEDIEELRALVEFMRFVKVIGFIPDPPKELMGSQKFSAYLSDFIDYMDGGRRIRESIPVIEFFSKLETFEELNEEDLSKQASVVSSIYPHWTEEDGSRYAEALVSLNEKTNENPASDIVQSVVEKIYLYQKKFNQDPDLTTWNFAMGYLNAFSYESDFTVLYKKMLGEELFSYFISALVEFVKIRDAEKLEECLKALEIESNE